MQHHVNRPDERPDIEVLVDGVWCEGELRMWSQREDGTWQADVQWRPNGEPTRRLHTFAADWLRSAPVHMRAREGYLRWSEVIAMLWLWIVIPVLVFLWLTWVHHKRHEHDPPGPETEQTHFGQFWG